MDHAERLAAALQGMIWGMISAEKAQQILNDYRQAIRDERKNG